MTITTVQQQLITTTGIWLANIFFFFSLNNYIFTNIVFYNTLPKAQCFMPYNHVRITMFTRLWPLRIFSSYINYNLKHIMHVYVCAYVNIFPYINLYVYYIHICCSVIEQMCVYSWT